MARLELQLLGPLSVRIDGAAIEIRGAKLRALAATLSLHNNEVVSTATIITYLWDEPLPDRAEHTLQQHVSALRKHLTPANASDGTSVLVTRDPGYRLHLDDFDVDRFTTAAEGAAGLARAGQTHEALAGYDEALAMVRGAPLADVRSSMRLLAVATRLEERIGALAEDRIDTALALGMHRDVVPLLEQLIDQQPYRERLRGQLMLALYRSGRQTDALAAYRATRELLIDELGVEPGRPLRELEQAILVQDPGLDHAPAPDGRALHRTFRAGAAAEHGWLELPDGQILAITASMKIGRAPDAEVRLVDSRVSRDHAHIELSGGGPRLEDLGSTNGTTINGVVIKSQPLLDGDEIGIGGVLMRYRSGGDGVGPPG